MDVVGASVGDRETISIRGPGDVVLGERSDDVADSRVQGFRFFGKRRPAEGWAPGRYLGRYLLTRPAASTPRVLLDVRREIVVP